VIQHGKQRGCGNTAGASAKYGRVRPCRFPPHRLSSVHQSLRACLGESWSDRVRNPRLRIPDPREKLHAAALQPRWNSRRLFLSESSPPEYAHIATTPATVRPVHTAAIVKDEVPYACLISVRAAAVNSKAFIDLPVSQT
jgi:hypothetical protein